MKLTRVMLVWLAGCLAASAQGTSTVPAKVEAVPAVPDNSDEVSTLLASGRNCLMEGKWPEAVALLEKARLLQPANGEAAFGLSAAFIELKRYEDALPLLESLARTAPDNPMVKNNLAWVLLHVKNGAADNQARAIKLARSALMAVPSDYAIWNTLGEAYYASGQFEKAMKAAQSGLRLSLLAGVTNSPCRELVARSRKAAGAAVLGELESEHP